MALHVNFEGANPAFGMLKVLVECDDVNLDGLAGLSVTNRSLELWQEG